MKWERCKPPQGELVEARDNEGEIHRVRAVYGSDGVRPHWESEDGDTIWSPSAFPEWRRISK
jgi:hypothetical protein